MDGPNTSARFFLSFLLILFFSSMVSAQIAVSIQSVRVLHANELYTGEVNEFKILAVNLSNERIVGERFQVQVSPELVLLEKGVETAEQSFLVPEVLPNQAVELRFVVRALSEPSANAVISVNFGQQVFSDLTATRLEIVPSPLRVLVQPEKNVVATGEVSALMVSLINDSNSAVQGIRSELLSSEREDSLSKPFEAAELQPNQAQENLRFEFWPRPLASGKHQLVVKTVFSDALGSHTLENRVDVQVRETTSFLVFLVGALVIVGLLYWLWLRMVHKAPAKLHAGK